MPQILGKEVGPIGYGLMGFTWRPTPVPEEQAFAAMKASLAVGCNFWNAGEFYGTPEYNSLHLLNRYFTKYPEDAPKVVLSIKGGLKGRALDGSPENIKNSIENCLRILDGAKSIDIFECARVDPNTPIEITLKALKEHVEIGNIGGIGLSEVSAATIRRAVKVTNIVAVEAELSLWSLDILSNGVTQACAEFHIPVVGYSPIGHGMLTGQIKSPDDIPEGDFRRTMPRFSKENFETNLELVRQVQELAKNKDCTPAQLAIAWVKHLSKKDGNPEIFPLPGATTVAQVEENGEEVGLSVSDIEAIDKILQGFEVRGDRYDDHQMKLING
ncbi:hypothetical protein ACEPPN_016667 [Leptodophora sp. 'Broadleaf-Isolate-01']